MCSASRPRTQPLPPPPQMSTSVTEDEAVLRESQRERRRAASRQGRQSTILTEPGQAGMAPTTMTKTALGS